MRIYLVVVDESREAEIALRFAARRAAKTRGGVRILVLVPPTEFVQWGSVQATMEDEARERAEALIASAAGMLVEESGIKPTILVEKGDALSVVKKVLAETNDIAGLVLGAAEGGAPGPLVTYFSGAEAGRLPCPVMIIPGALSREDVDRLS